MPLGWYSRGYLPHFDRSTLCQFVMFRLADSLPDSVLLRMERELRTLPKERFGVERRKRIEAYLDQGHGEAFLATEPIGTLLENALLFFDGQRYTLHAWVVMPNHVHVLFTPADGYDLAGIIMSWKSYTANEINKIRGTRGTVWQREYFDRFIRSEEHYWRAANYAEQNPVKAGLRTRAEDWKFSSARRRQTGDATAS